MAVEHNQKPGFFLLRRRTGNFAAFLLCAALLAFAYYLQFAQGLAPCPLCILQRVLVFATGIAFLVAALHHPRKTGGWIYGWVTAVIALIGAGVAARHVWLQHTPEDKRPACGPGLDYLLSTFGPFESLQRILRGSGECGTVDWTFLGLSIPEWTLACFIGLAAYALVLASRDPEPGRA
jgi:disulfide bond formation protein DsbB